MGRRAPLIRPPALRRGDLIAAAAPAGVVDRAAFLRGASFIASRGYQVAYREDIFSREGYLAGDDARRADELNGYLRDPAVKAILFARGGYGTSRILERLDLAAFRRRPKLVAGFSDLTVLLLALTQRAGVAAVHGTFVSSAGKRPGGERDMARLLSLLAGEPPPPVTRGLRRLRPGRATAPVTGGNLSLLAHSVGTPFAVETRGRVLFVEEVNEAPYRIDRAVRQLALAGAFRGLAGLILGSFTGCTPAERKSVERLFLEAVGDRAVPVVAGFPAGHASPNHPVPLGVPATVDADAPAVSFGRLPAP
jgi:muramoyltetrapeptide carboxypeptidase